MNDEPTSGSPELASLADLIGEATRSRMLVALLAGRALTATELAVEAGVSSSTASSHLSKLVEGRLLRVVRQGRHRYFQLLDHEVADMLERMMGIASRDAAPRRGRLADAALAAARVCYDHLAGAAGVWMADQLLESGHLTGRDAFELSPQGAAFFEEWGIDVASLLEARRALCRTCLDWSERRFHLGGALGAAILRRLVELRWVEREPDSRVLTFPASGDRSFRARFEAPVRSTDASNQRSTA
jgi:DNA-binding transcriptional ArsR family regulator